MRHHPARARSAVWLTIGALAILPLAACASAGASAASPLAGTVADEISISTGACGGSWHLAAPGPHTFQIHNSASDAAEVELINPVNGAVYDDIENLGAGTTDPMPVNVGSGSYAFRCLIEDTDAITGPTEKVPGHTAGETAILPVTDNDLLASAAEYHKYVTGGLVTLASQVNTLNSAIQGAIQGGNLAAARSAWLPAHLTYERLGAAYDSFGDFDGEIDGRADGLAGGVDSPDWTGFYRLEYGLWHGQSAASLKKLSSQLTRDVSALQKSWPSTQIDLLDMGLRTHEILENALQFQVSGHDDYGSGTTLATTEANITGTEVLLTELHPVLAPRYAGLPAVSTWLNRLQKLIEATRTSHGWTAVSKLPTPTRQAIDAAASQALVELAPIADITEPRRQ
ncbi:MAG TPA: EfeM/EfeO family lipoprotein [Streptosporangiaceae bacterium]|jgi:iron uptake system component EfeO|nr:EfeM/EfeO family lipoprotein [Streptosporangiaceae bacterium]